MTYKDLLTRIKMDDKDILNVYQYGSRVYGTDRQGSDWDFVIIVSRKERDEYSDNLVNVFFYTPLEFDKKLKDHEITAIECFFLPEHLIWKEKLKFSFEVKKSSLRSSLSAKADNSFVKAHKKLSIEKDYDLVVGKKSLFHSFRIITYGIQLAEAGKITNYQACNELFYEITHNYNTWSELFKAYKNKYNNLKSEFRILAPK